MKKLIVYFILTIAIPVLAANHAVAHEIFSKDVFVSNSELEKNGGRTLKLGKFGSFKIRKATSDILPNKDCFVHIPKLRRHLFGLARNGALGGGPASVQLQSHTCGEGSGSFLCCYDSGTGCTILVVPAPSGDN